jgi:hypothetical protein
MDKGKKGRYVEGRDWRLDLLVFEEVGGGGEMITMMMMMMMMMTMTTTMMTLHFSILSTVTSAP